MKTDPALCPACGGAIEPNRAAGLCLACVLGDALNVDGTDGAADGPLGFIGDLELLEVIARGGMGVVYRARQSHPEREVALKALPGASLLSREARDRFRLESQAMASLDHPGILPVFEAGEADETPFFTMKFARGGSLAQRIIGLDGKWREIAELMVRVADAIEFAHQRGILHRDIKPGNILFDEAGNVFVSDFGLARLIGQESDLTRTIGMLGTPNYLAPEIVATGVARATVSTDVWSLGAVLYELLGGRPPFAGDSAPAVLRKIAEEDPGALPGRVPRPLRLITGRCLEKNPLRRYGSAGDLAADLRRWLAGEPVLARPPFPLARQLMLVRRHPLMTALFLLFVLALGGLYLTERERKSQNLRAETAGSAVREETRRSLLESARVGRVTMSTGWTTKGLVALREAAAIRPGSDLRDEAIRHLAGWDLVPYSEPISPKLRWKQVTSKGQVEAIKWWHDPHECSRSPDGRWILFCGYDSEQARHAMLVQESDHALVRHWPAAFHSFPQPFRNQWLFLEEQHPNEAPSIRSVSLENLKEHRLETAGIWQRAWPQINSSEPLVQLIRGQALETWNAQTGKQVASVVLPSVPTAVAESPDWLALGDESGGIKLFDPGSGETIPLPGGRNPITAIALPADTPLLLATDNDGFTAWNIFTRQIVLRQRLSNLMTRGVSISNIAPYLVRFSSQPTPHVISPSRVVREFGLTIPGHENGMGLESSLDGRWFTASSGEAFAIADSATGRLLLVQSFPGERITNAVPVIDDDHLLIQLDRRIALFRMDRNETGRVSLSHVRDLKTSESGFLNYLMMSTDRRWAALPSAKDRIEVLDLQTPGLWQGYPVPFAPRATNVSADGRWLVTGSKSAGAKLLRWPLGQPDRPEIIREGGSAPKFSPDSRWLADKDFNSQSLRVWDTATWECVYQSPPGSEDEWPGSVCWSWDSRLFAVGMADGRVRLLAAGTWETIAHLQGQRMGTSKVRFLADGRTLLVGDRGAIEAWDLGALASEMDRLGLPLGLPPAQPK